MTNQTLVAQPESRADSNTRFGRFGRFLKPETFCVLFLFIFSAPGLFWLYPSVLDRMESYQPMQALKFFATHGKTFHKYGPFPNFVLAPFYGLTLGIWRLLGTFRPPYSVFPYGFSHPVEQIAQLIVEGRFVFMILCLLSAYIFVRRLQRLSSSWLLLTVVSVALLASNYCYTVILASNRPDAPMMAFGTFFMALYLDAVLDGLTLRRGLLLGLSAVCAVSSKELIYAMFLLPVLFLILRAAFGRDPELRPGKPLFRWVGLVGLVTFSAYALIDIVYAPSIWLQRIRFWTKGDGMDPSIWGNEAPGAVFRNGLLCAFENLGVGGAILLVIAVLFLLIKRPRHSLALSLPAISFLVFAIARIHFSEIRYFMPFSIALLPLVVLGLEAARSGLSAGRPQLAFSILLFACLIPNLVWGMFAWYDLDGQSEVTIYRHILASPNDHTYYVFSLFPQGRGSEVLSEHGYRFEDRSFQQIIDDNGPWPDEIDISYGMEYFIKDALSTSTVVPGRTDYMRQQGFYAPGWTGFETNGYCRVATLEPSIPQWFPFKWMYGVHELELQDAVHIYSRHCP
jgi:hypothetical protein